jgi:hypothetical protein
VLRSRDLADPVDRLILGHGAIMQYQPRTISLGSWRRCSFLTWDFADLGLCSPADREWPIGPSSSRPIGHAAGTAWNGSGLRVTRHSCLCQRTLRDQDKCNSLMTGAYCAGLVSSGRIQAATWPAISAGLAVPVSNDGVMRARSQAANR